MRRLLIALPIALLVLAVAVGAGYYVLNSTSAPARTVTAAEIALEPVAGDTAANAPLQAAPKPEPSEPKPEPKSVAPVESPKPAPTDDSPATTLAELEEKLKASGTELDPAQLDEIKKTLAEKLLEVGKHQVTLKGKVVDHTGTAVAGANIVVAVPGEGRRLKSTSLRAICNSDAQGNFEGTYVSRSLDGAAFDIEIYARSDDAPESERQRLAVTPGETYDGITLTLPQGAGVTGRVVDSTFNPIANARVQATTAGPRDKSPAARPRSTTTDADGRFTLKGLAAGTYTISVVAIGYKAAETWPSVEVAIGDPTALPADIVMITQTSLKCRLTCADATPTGSFAVEFILPDGKTARGAGWADKDGNALISSVPLEAAELRILKRGYFDTARIAIAPAKDQHVDLGEIPLEKDPNAKEYPNRGESDGEGAKEKLKQVDDAKSKLPAKD